MFHIASLGLFLGHSSAFPSKVIHLDVQSDLCDHTASLTVLKEVKVRLKTKKFLEENRENLHDIGLGNDSIDMAPKA